MASYDKIFEGMLEKALSELSELHTEEDLDDFIKETLDEFLAIASNAIMDDLMVSGFDSLEEELAISSGFVERNLVRWKKGFDLLDLHISICRELGSEFNTKYRPEAAKNENYVFAAVVALHANACLIASEILCLLKNGYPDGAHARWRALHEVSVTAFFLCKHGNNCAKRFLDYEHIESYKSMVMVNTHKSRLQISAFTEYEVTEARQFRDELMIKYGPDFKNNYGWAAPFLNISKPNFAQIESDVNLDHMRPYYKWASQNVHATSLGMSNKLGKVEAKKDLLLAGQSNSGMTDPAHATALSLMQITSNILHFKQSLEHQISVNVTIMLAAKIGDAFLEASSPTEFPADSSGAT
jgi:hypothetical protein